MRGAIAAGAAVLALALVTTACSSGSSTSTSTTAGGSLTTTTVAAPVAPFAKTGPYPVGFTMLHLAGGRRVVVWYPAQGTTSGHARETIDIASMLSPALQARIPAKDRVLYHDDAFSDLTAAATTSGFPLVIFSHGFAGYPEQSVSLTTHLASWGFVVAAPDHVERSLDGLLGTGAAGVPKMSDLAVLQATIALMLSTSKSPGLLHGIVDPTKIVAAGHSAGAGAAYQLASADSRVKAWISYSVGFGGQAGPAPPAPNKPGMVMLGTADGIIAPAQSERVYAGMHSPKYLVKIGGAGHLVFSDICLIGRSAGGITGIARALKLPIPKELLKLGSDGCTKDHPPVEKAFPAIDQLSVAFFRWALQIDLAPHGLDTQAVAGLGANVTVTHT